MYLTHLESPQRLIKKLKIYKSIITSLIIHAFCLQDWQFYYLSTTNDVDDQKEMEDWIVHWKDETCPGIHSPDA